MIDQMKPSYLVTDRFVDSEHWTWTERLIGEQNCFFSEPFISKTEWKAADVIHYFQSSAPHSEYVLLHYLAPLEQVSDQPPILLIHGAGHHARKAWGDRKKGLIHALSLAGRHVFALTFAHPHGDNLLQAIQLQNGIQRMKELCGSETVDLIAHSKGGIVAWTYLANRGSLWNAAYDDDVTRCFLLGSPNKGLDYPFRHMSPNWMVQSFGISAPIACDSMFYLGHYFDTMRYSIYKEGGAFPGSSQLLYRWDDKYPVHLGAQKIYEGGQDLLFHSRGIDAAIQDGGDYMECLMKTPIAPDIEVHILAGNSPFIHGVCTEWDGESDGLVFVDSALSTEGLVVDDHQVCRKTVLPLNHLQLLYHPLAHQWVLDGYQQHHKRFH